MLLPTSSMCVLLSLYYSVTFNAINPPTVPNHNLVYDSPVQVFPLPSFLQVSHISCASLCSHWVFTFHRSHALVQCYISALLLAFLLLVIIHMCVFHAFSNLASELTRFADRQFYNVSLFPLPSFSS